MITRILYFTFKLLIIFVVVALLIPSFRGKVFELFGQSPKIADLKVSLKKVESDFDHLKASLPEPLIVNRVKDLITAPSLNNNLIFLETNNARSAEGVLPLVYNDVLAKAASNKVDDMFTLGYFEHNSPSGKTPSMVIAEAGYSYLTAGENLAMGMFKDEKDLVDAWMNSPGHRANILSKNFSEVGISAKKGLYEGKEVWMAVQEFGKSSNVCPLVSDYTKEQIELKTEQIDALNQLLESTKSTIDNMSKRDREKYNELVSEYNDLVRDYNSLVRETKETVEQYNLAIKAYNDCLKIELGQ